MTLPPWPVLVGFALAVAFLWKLTEWWHERETRKVLDECFEELCQRLRIRL